MQREFAIRDARPEDASVLVEFNRAMARETESKELQIETVSAGVAGLLANPRHGFYVMVECASEVIARADGHFGVERLAQRTVLVDSGSVCMWRRRTEWRKELTKRWECKRLAISFSKSYDITLAATSLSPSANTLRPVS